MNVRLKSLAVAATMVVGWSTGAHAALTPAPLDCAAGGVALSPADYDSCQGAFLGNDSQLDFQDEINGVFGTMGTWTEFAKAEEDNSWEDGTLDILTGQGDSTGTFEISGLPTTAVFVVKSAGCFSAYLFSGIGSPATGSFDTAAAGLQTSGTCDGNLGPGISHLSVYTGGNLPNVNIIPLPASALLLLGGIGGLGALRAARRKAA